MLQWAHIGWLALLPLPLAVTRLLPSFRQAAPTLRLPFIRRIARLTGQRPGQVQRDAPAPQLQRLLNWLVWLLLVCALARPQWLEEPLTRTVPMRDLLVAVDLSGSMETRDFSDGQGTSVDRLSAVKQVLGAFLERRQDDRVGLLVFGSAAFVQIPFTADHAVVQQLLEETTVRMAGPRTVIGDAIGLALTLFDRSQVEERLLILLTDGNDTGSQVPPARAAEIARDRNIIIHTIGVGDPRAAGEEALDEAALRTVASTTGGRYFRAADRNALEGIYAELDRLTPRKVQTLSHRPRRDLFHWPLAAALLLTFLQQAACALQGRHAPAGGPPPEKA